jgi:RNA polymerase sigma-70 factor (ECF subfamily)
MTLAIPLLASELPGTDLNEGDQTLAGRFAADEAGAFEEVVAVYQARVARLAQRLLGWNGDADDVVQDVFLDALTAARRFRGEAALWTWLSTITVNRCRRRARRAVVSRRFRQWLKARPNETSEPAADAQAIGDERCRCVRRAVSDLPMREREAVVLFYLEGRSIDESSEILRTSPNAIAVRLHRARERLAVALNSLKTEDMK